MSEGEGLADAATADGAAATPAVGAVPAVGVLSRIVWALAGAVFSQGSVFISSVVLARLLGHEGFGRYAVVQTTVAMLGGFAGMGLGTTATKFVAESSARDKERTGRILGLCTAATAATGVLFAGTLALGAPLFARAYHATDLVTELRIGGLYVLFYSLNTFQIGALAGFSAFSKIARISLFQGAIGIALLAAGTYAWGVTGAAAALGVGAFTSWAQHQIALRDECRRAGIRVRYRGLATEAPVLSTFALPAALAGVVGGAATMAASTLLVRQVGGLREMATFNAANTIRMVVLFVPGLVARVATPLLCHLRGDKDDTAYRRTFSYVAIANTLLASTAALSLFLLGPWLLALYGRDFAQGRGVLGTLLVSAVLETLAVALFQIVYSHGRMWTHLAILCLWSVLLTGVTVVVAPAHGAIGLALAYLVAWGASAPLYGFFARALLRADAERADAGLSPAEATP